MCLIGKKLNKNSIEVYNKKNMTKTSIQNIDNNTFVQGW